MAKKVQSDLKKRALIAKKRLKMGYFDKLSEERSRLECDDKLGAEEISKLQRERLDRDTRLSGGEAEAKREEALYEKVCAILSADEETLNPIGQLIDKREYMRLDDAGKQRYILQLSREFRKLSERYYLERRRGSEA